MKKGCGMASLVVFLLFPSALARSEPVLREIWYQQKTTQSCPRGCTVRFSLWDAEAGGSEVWSEEKVLRVTGGVVKTWLGSEEPLNPADFERQLWVQVERKTVGSYEAFGEREPLGIVPYAMWSQTAGGVGAALPSDTVLNLDGGPGAGSSLLYSRGDHRHGIGTGAVTGANLQDGTIKDADVSPGAAIGYSKLAGVAAAAHHHDSVYVNEGQAGSVTTGMIADGTIAAADVKPTEIQKRVKGTCAEGTSIRIVNEDGTVACEADDSGTGGGTPSGTVATLDGVAAPGSSGDYSRGDHRHGIGTGAVTSAHVKDDTITDADVASGAAIAYTKLAGVAAAAHHHDSVYVNEGQANSVTSAMITDGSIGNADIAAGAGIVGGKLASDGSVVKSLTSGTNIGVVNNANGSWTINATGTLATPVSVSNGGTGATTAAAARDNLGAAASGANADITSLAGLTTPLLVSQGGTGSGTKNFVDLSTAQTIGGMKTFSSSITSSVASGTPPFTVTSTAVVANLNADTLDGKHAIDLGLIGDNWGSQTVVTDATLTGSGVSTNTLRIAQQAATTGQVLKWNGNTWAPSNDLHLTLPYEGSLTSPVAAFKVINNDVGAGAIAIEGITASTSSDAAVYGLASSLTGIGKGIYGCAFSPNGYSGYFDSGRFYVGGNAGIGVFSPSAKLEVNGQVKITGGTPGAGKVLTSDAAGLGSWADPMLVLPYTATTSSDYPVFAFTNDGGGNGIHAVSNSQTGVKAGVIGDSYSSSGAGVIGNAYATDGTTYGIKGKIASSSGYSGYFEGGRFYVQGNVGIGYNAPSEKLEVNGNVQLRAGANRYILFPDNSMSLFVGGKPGVESAYALIFLTDDGGGSGVERLTIKADKVGIGTTGPTQILDVNGNARFRSVTSGAYSNNLNITGDGTLTTATSDGRLKGNVHTLKNSLDKIMQLRGVTFTWKNNPEYGTRIGFIAQEFEQVIPELVFANPVDGYKGISYPEISAVLVEAIKELKAENELLKDRLEKLEKKPKSY